MSQYIFEENRDDQELGRLRLIEQALDEESIARLQSTGIRPGWRCLELWAGAGSTGQADQADIEKNTQNTNHDGFWIVCYSNVSVIAAKASESSAGFLDMPASAVGCLAESSQFQSNYESGGVEGT